MIKFKEDKDSLKNRINIHSQYGNKDMVEWISGLIKNKKKINILDLACGDGTQTFALKKFLKKKGMKSNILATDSNNELLKVAKKKNKDKSINFRKLNFNNKFNLGSKKFDAVICLFGIYYSKKISFTIKEIKKVLKENGQLILVGPLRDNKLDFNKILEKATNKKIPPLIGSSRFDSLINNIVQKEFKYTKIRKFINILRISDKSIYTKYMLSSVTNKRGVYKTFLKSDSFKNIEKKFNNYLDEYYKKNKILRITKKVGAIIAKK
jgi:ubiquinone/menaquinone biosynthesis C-methylase UbiE